MNLSFLEHGVECLIEDKVIFFGNKHFQEESMALHYPNLRVRKINQVHGDRVIEASSEDPSKERIEAPSQVLLQAFEADGHFTGESDAALRILTADCLPVFVLDLGTDRILAVHAGWRGVENKILSKGIQQLIDLGGRPTDFRVIIGPHIRHQSFEVHGPVWEALKKSIPLTSLAEEARFVREKENDGNSGVNSEEPSVTSDNHRIIENKKYLVDLELIVKAQIIEQRVLPHQVESIAIDTFSNPLWHSYRRDREKAGRNFSFIAKHSGMITPSR